MPAVPTADGDQAPLFCVQSSGTSSKPKTFMIAHSHFIGSCRRIVDIANWVLEDRYAYSAANSRIATYDMMEYDWSGQETAKLLAAIDTTDLGKQYYRLGDFMWVRLAAPTRDASIVAGWSSPSLRGRRSRWVVFDDGHTELVKGRAWKKLWKADTAARRTFGLPPVNPIPP